MIAPIARILGHVMAEQLCVRANSVLDDAIRDGKWKSPESAPFLSESLLSSAVAPYSIKGGSDMLGWRDSFMKFCVRASPAAVATILDRFAAGALHPAVLKFVYGWNVFFLEDVQSGDSRVIIPPSVVAKTIGRCIVADRKAAGSAKQLGESGQLGIGTPDGIGIAGSLKKIAYEMAGNGMVLVVIDGIKFYYKMSHTCIVEALAQLGEFDLLHSFKLQSLSGFNVIAYRPALGAGCTIPPPLVGIPPGFATSALIGALVLHHLMVQEKQDRLGMIAQFPDGHVDRRFWESMSEVLVQTIADDISLLGEVGNVIPLLKRIADRAAVAGVARFGAAKSGVLPLGTRIAGSHARVPSLEDSGFDTGNVLTQVSVALMPPSKREDFVLASAQALAMGGPPLELFFEDRVSLVVSGTTGFPGHGILILPNGKEVVTAFGFPVIMDAIVNVGVAIGAPVGVARRVEQVMETHKLKYQALASCPSIQSGLLVLMSAAASAWVPLARSEPPSVVRPVYSIPMAQETVKLLQTQLGSDIIGHGSEHRVQRLVAELPWQEGGLGLISSFLLCAGAFLGGFLNAVSFVQEWAASADNILPRWLSEAVSRILVQSDDDGQYAMAVHQAHSEFLLAFRAVHAGRDPTPLQDGFSCSLESLIPLANRFQSRATSLRNIIGRKKVVALLSPAQLKTLDSGSSTAAASAIRALPTLDAARQPNAVIRTIISRRLLTKNSASAVLGDVCPRNGCPRGKPGSALPLEELNLHLESCICGGNHITVRHNCALAEVKSMLVAAGAAVNPLSPTVDPVIQSKLRAFGQASGKPLPRTRFGAVKGGDLTSQFPGESVVVLDIRIPVEGADKYAKAVSAANQAEFEKRGMYSEMYKGIQYDFIGVAVEVGGRLGDALVALIDKCAQKADPDLLWELPGISYVTPTFFGYWAQRIVLAAQRANASMVNGLAGALAHRRSYVPPRADPRPPRPARPSRGGRR